MANLQLNFNMQAQLNSEWCWAANSTSVSLFYDSLSTWTQCKVACAALGRNDCCLPPTPAACNVSYYLNLAYTVTGNFVNMVGNPLPMAQIEGEINAQRVIGVRIGWYGGGGHFIVIYGYDDSSGTDFVYADDPIYGKTYYNLATFTTAYQSAGNWTHSYFTKSTGGAMLTYVNVNKDLLAKAKLLTPWKLLDKTVGEHELYRIISHVPVPKGIPHEVYVIDFNILKGGAMEMRKTGVRVIDQAENNDHLIFEFNNNGPDAVLQQVIHGKSFTDNYYNALEGVISERQALDQSFQLRLIRQPELKVEAVWLHQDGPFENDEFVPVFGNDFLTAGTEYTENEFLKLLTTAARNRKVNFEDNEIGG